MAIPVPEPAAPPIGSGRRWTLAALLVFACATASLLHGCWGRSPAEVAPVGIPERLGLAEDDYTHRILRFDHRFTVWLVARNAYTLLHRPGALFDAEPCHPAGNALAFGEPAIALGLLGTPAWLLTGDPVTSYNAVLLAFLLIAPYAMFLLVRDWTGSAAAGIVAGLLYGFHEIRVLDVIHLYIYDSAWTVLALLFARRWFEGSRWRDALGLAGCCAMQLGGSLYLLIASSAIALPVTAWLVVRYGLRRLRAAQVAVVLGTIVLTAAFVFTPYLELQGSGALPARDLRAFLMWPELLPGAARFPGWALLLLAAAGLAAGRLPRGGDPRWALLAAALLTLSLAAFPRFYLAIASLVPGAEVIRAVALVYAGTHLTLCILAGLGAAALLRIAPRRYAVWAAVALIACAYLDTLRPRTLGLTPRFRYAMLRLRPDEATLAFYRELEALGNDGPILEVPLAPDNYGPATDVILLSAYHHRRVSACYNSFWPEEAGRVTEISSRLPRPRAIQALRKLGFTTMVVHHGKPDSYAERHRKAIENFATATRGRFLRRLHADDALTAYSIMAPVGERSPPAPAPPPGP